MHVVHNEYFLFVLAAEDSIGNLLQFFNGNHAAVAVAEEEVGVALVCTVE